MTNGGVNWDKGILSEDRDGTGLEGEMWLVDVIG